MKGVNFIKSKFSFTLVELLVVIGILAVLTAAVILIINPVEYLRQARDVTRMNDLGSIDKALSVLETQGITSFGSANTVYVSIADNASSTCGSLGLSALPSGWSYHCVSSTNLQKTDGNGWIPVNFTQSSALSFSNLPLDPVNATSTGNYYTYVTGGSWELTTIFESSKYAQKAATDGGVDPAQYETGTNLALSPFAHGLVAWYKLNEGSGLVAHDSSGNGHDADLASSPNTPIWVAEGLSPATASSYVNVSNAAFTFGTGSWTLMWVARFHTRQAGGYGIALSVNDAPVLTDYWGLFGYRMKDGNWPLRDVTTDQWHSFAYTYDGAESTSYINGASPGTYTFSLNVTGTTLDFLGVKPYSVAPASDYKMATLIMYNRKLQSNEIAANYNYFKTVLAARGITLP